MKVTKTMSSKEVKYDREPLREWEKVAEAKKKRMAKIGSGLIASLIKKPLLHASHIFPFVRAANTDIRNRN